jgi:hypothetical protein
MHRYRISFLTGVATGFVLGARAGRERYDQIVKVARTVAEHPAVQQAAGVVQAQATGLAGAAGTKITDEVRDRVPKLAKTARAKAGDRVPGLRSKNGHARGAHDHNSNGGGRGHEVSSTGHGGRDGQP